MKNSNILAWIESFVITALFIVCLELLQDPLSIKASFPWIWFAPVLIALRYGLGPTILSIILISICYFYHFSARPASISMQLSVLGGFLLTLLCIIFHSRWSRKITKAEALSTYLEQRVQSTAHAYKIVLFSFQRLEHSIVSSPVTLRSSLEQLRELLGRSGSKTDPEILTRFLNILAFHCSLEIAGIYQVEKSQVSKTPLCSIGRISLSSDDFLIREALEKRAMAYVSTEEILKGHLSDYLIVAPLIDQENEIYALLIVKELPFLKLSNENLEVITFLITYFCDGAAVKGAEKILEAFPDCPIDFANELQRLTNLYEKTKQESAITVLDFSKGPHQADYLFKVKQEKRGLDRIWEHKNKKSNIKLLTLMPLTSPFGVESYKIRMSESMEKEFSIPLNGEELRFKYGLISAFKDPIKLIEDLLTKK